MGGLSILWGELENPLETMMELSVLLNTIPVALYLFLG